MAKVVEQRGALVGALITQPGDEVLVIMEGGKVVRSSVDEVNLTGRNTQGVRFVRPDNGDHVIAMAPHLETDAGSADSADSAGSAPSSDSASSAGSAATPPSVDETPERDDVPGEE